jgi:hypothetical protein
MCATKQVPSYRRPPSESAVCSHSPLPPQAWFWKRPSFLLAMILEGSLGDDEGDEQHRLPLWRNRRRRLAPTVFFLSFFPLSPPDDASGYPEAVERVARQPTSVHTTEHESPRIWPAAPKTCSARTKLGVPSSSSPLAGAPERVSAPFVVLSSLSLARPSSSGFSCRR